MFAALKSELRSTQVSKMIYDINYDIILYLQDFYYLNN